MADHQRIRRLADAIPQPVRDLGYATGQVAFSTDPYPLGVTVLGRYVQMPFYGPRPAVGDPVGVLFVAGAPICLGVPTGLPDYPTE